MNRKKKAVLSTKVKVFNGRYHPIHDWEMDKKGYFLIRVNRRKKQIDVGFCRKNNVIEMILVGKKPQDIYFTAIEKNLLSRMDHAAYLGKELEKAYLALKYKLDYVQDEELEF